jgi:branched-chain amino acid aminotransferase
MKQLYFSIPAWMTESWLQAEADKLARKNKLEQLCRVRLQIFAESGGLYESTIPKPEYLIECFPLDEPILALNENGLVCGIAQSLSKSADSLANIKSSNALIYAMAAQQAKEHKWNDALVRNTNGNVIESTIANIFIIKDQQIHTPALSEGCVAGVMRRWIIDTLQKQDIAVIESAINQELLAGAEEVFLSNAIRRVKWVKNIEGRHYGNEYTRHLYQILFS